MKCVYDPTSSKVETQMILCGDTTGRNRSRQLATRFGGRPMLGSRQYSLIVCV